MEMNFPGAVVSFTERYLNHRRYKRNLKAHKAKKKNIFRELAEAILFALVVVIVIQSLFFELYVIPTGSMIPTIEIGTRAVMDKMSFGPEIIRDLFGTDVFRKPEHGEVIMFLNPDPSLKPMGPFERVLHKFLFIATLTLVDIDRDEYGNPRPRLLLKRVIGEGGERIRFRNGNAELLMRGESEWITESDLQKRLGLHYPVRRLLDPSKGQDTYSLEMMNYRIARERNPADREVSDLYRKKELGFYIPEDSFFPMGDNRDRSRDARVYGPVKLDNLLGKALIRVWPFKNGFTIE